MRNKKRVVHHDGDDDHDVDDHDHSHHHHHHHDHHHHGHNDIDCKELRSHRVEQEEMNLWKPSRLLSFV